MQYLSDEQLQKAHDHAKASIGCQGAAPGFAAEIARREAAKVEIETENDSGLFRWQWNDKIGNRSRQAACLVVSPEGKIFYFDGEDIPNVAKVLKREYSKRGKWSNTTYTVLSRIGTIHIGWRQSWGEALFWPQASWEEAVAWVQSQAPLASQENIKVLIRSIWPATAKRFDEKNSFFS